MIRKLEQQSRPLTPNFRVAEVTGNYFAIQFQMHYVIRTAGSAIRRAKLDVRVLLVPAGCFFVRMSDPAQHRFAQRLSGELHAQRQPFG
jgi:hypothetical protein